MPPLRTNPGSTADHGSAIIRIPPNNYIHVLDKTTNISRLYLGPKTHIRQENERLVFGPEPMVSLTSFNYCKISNPVLKDEKGEIVFEHGAAKLRFGREEYRFNQQPFPLYPGEILSLPVTPLEIVKPNDALVLSALLDFVDSKGIKRIAGDEWLLEGPATYYPRIEETVKTQRTALIVKKGDAIRLRALRDCIDRQGKKRKYGEEWIVTTEGAYLHGPYEEFVQYVTSIPLDEQARPLFNKISLHSVSIMG
ncbi:unnamed protein product [Protopolystoma xenopodis]|uniref:Major vault protein n=1 Tax=Protopolystoma xenopodis TaxID=117903 RepID=A0A3S5FDT1_9PLAT|nr:unnamed protein product [Protopolystoma xenopodis]